MYGIPKKEDFKFLNGSSVIDIKIESAVEKRKNNHYILVFLDSGQQIHIEGGYKIVGYSDNGRKASINDLIGASINSVQVRSEFEMVINFDKQFDLYLFDDESEFECIQFYPENIII